MQKLTKAEEDIMYHIWKLGRCTVSQIIDELGEPRSPHSTISSIVRILEQKGFLNHKAYGRTYEYFPIVEKKDYTKKSVGSLVKNYFDGSVSNLVSFLVEEENLSQEDVNEILEKLKNTKDD